jgi:phosphatidylglycerol:prolipoprotein diacylglycerol transferase
MKPTFLPFLGQFAPPAYMTLLMVGFTLAIWMGRREEDRIGRNGDRIVDLGLYMLIFGVIGARLLSVLADGHLQDFINLCVDPKQVPPADGYARAIICQTNAQCGDYYLCDTTRHACYPPQDCLEVFKFWHGGLAYYGGFLLAAPVGLWYARKKDLGVWRIADLTAPLIMFGLFFGRMGCFYNGCCYGRPSDLPWAMRFPGHAARVHPTQLYEAIGALAIYALLQFVIKPRKRAHGQVFGAMLVLYAVLRFVLEFFRDDERGAAAGLSTSQWIGIPLLLLGVYVFVRRGRWQPQPS